MYIKRQKIKIVLDSVKNGNDLLTSLKKARLSKTQWYKWENEIPRLAKATDAARNWCEDVRNVTAENELFRRIKDREATPVEMIFFLTNRLPDRWKDRRAVINNTNVNSVKIENHQERKFANEHDKAIANDMREWLAGRTSTGRSSVSAKPQKSIDRPAD